MPVTKKRGAIFAIYADSPVQNTASAYTAPTKITEPSATKTASPTKRSSTRQALTALQPKAPSTKLSSDASLKQKLSEKDVVTEKGKVGLKAGLEARQTSIQRSSLVLAPSTKAPRAASSAARKTISKKAFEVYQEPTESAIPSRITAEPASALSVRAPSKSEIANPKVSPAKRGRTVSTPKKEAVPVNEEDKENKPVVDSPASRTRSKTRIFTGATRPLSDVFVDKASSPLKTVKKTKDLKRLTSISVLADVTDAYGGSGDIPEGFTTAKR